jgi:hypothetical protein
MPSAQTPVVKPDGTLSEYEYWFGLDKAARQGQGGGDVPSSRTIAAGAGLTGGGDLSQDRALSVQFGTTAGTVAQGNDSRIAGAAQTSDLGSAAFDDTSSFAPFSHVGAGGAAHANVVAAGAAGFMSGSDKTKLDGIASGATVTNASTVTSAINGTTPKGSLVDADELPVMNSAASFGLARATWATFKSVLKTYFDTLYLSSTVSRREVLIAARTYYVRTDGNNSNNGLSNTSGGAFLTIQRAVDVVSALDMATYQVTIQIADGTYNEAVTLKPWLGASRPIVKGNLSTPANVVINATGNAFLNDGAGRWRVTDLKVIATSVGLRAANGGIIEYGNINFGACTSFHCFADRGSLIALSSYTISGDAGYHWNINKGDLTAQSITITLSGTRAFSYFIYVQRLSMALTNGITFSGSATGTRYYAESFSIILTSGGGASYFPGSSAGGVDADGRYS